MPLSVISTTHWSAETWSAVTGLPAAAKSAQVRSKAFGSVAGDAAQAITTVDHRELCLERPAMQFALLLVSAIGVAPPAYGQQAAPPAVPVGVVQAERKPISKTNDFVGRIEAIDRVQNGAGEGLPRRCEVQGGRPDQGRRAALQDRAGTVPGCRRAGAGCPGAQQGGKNAPEFNSSAPRS